MWMDLEGIMLSDVSQTEEDIYCMISLIYRLQNKTNQNKNKLIQKEIRFVATRGWGQVKPELVEGGHKVQTSSYKIDKY